MSGLKSKDKEKDDNASLVAGTTTLATQVGGHQYGKNGIKIGMLDRGNGIVLKALQNPPRGTRELTLYQTIFAPTCRDEHLLELRNFLPVFNGTEVIDDVTFLVMNNIAHSFYKPNVIDIKMGQITYDPEATAAKRLEEEKKYPPAKELGFRITGMMIHDISSDQAKHFTKHYFYSLTAENILSEGLGKFFGLHNGHLRKDVLNALLWKLRSLEDWFSKQRKYAFYSSSLLIVYGHRDPQNISSTSYESNLQADKYGSEDEKNLGKKSQNGKASCSFNLDCARNNNVKSDTSLEGFSKLRASQKRERSPESQEGHSETNLSPVRKQSKTSQMEDANTEVEKSSESCWTGESASNPSIVEVRMIDFAHVFPASGKDNNYLFGLQKLIYFVEELLKM